VEQLQKQFNHLRRENKKLNNQLRVKRAPQRARSRKEDIDRINVLETKIDKLKIVSRYFFQE
jgi:hypothetical protein